MKKIGVFFLCLVIFLLCAGGVGAWFYFSPRGVLHPGLPEDVMQEYMDSRSRSDWRADYIRLDPPEVTVFEDPAEIAGRLFDAAVGDGAFTFREEFAADPNVNAYYLVSGGGTDLFRVNLGCTNGVWAVDGLTPLELITPESRTLIITVPSDAEVAVNGVPLDESFLTEADVPYENMTEAELRFPEVPHRVRYAVPGLIEAATVEARRRDGRPILCLLDDGTTFDYTAGDAGAYAFQAVIPQDAVLRLGGAEFTAADAAATMAFDTRLDVPAELQNALPAYCVYSFGGLYTRELAPAVFLNGTELPAETREDGALVCRVPGGEALYEAHHQQVEKFLTDLCEYGAGHTGRHDTTPVIVPGSPVAAYVRNAIGSLYWTQNVTLTFRSVTSSDYYSLGDDAFYCRGRVDAKTHTWYQDVDLDMGYEMLWVRSDGAWLLQDMGFVEP